jgi:hypothetical protein
MTLIENYSFADGAERTQESRLEPRGADAAAQGR